jgi:hypothetical protein
MKENSIKSLFRHTKCLPEVSLNDFKKCLVHISYYENAKSSNPGNSRFVFLGMYAFKGFLARLVATYISGNGKQLQQYLGNVFSNEKLSVLADDLNLPQLATVHETINVEKIKHILALAYLGFVFEKCKVEFQEEIALKYFLVDSDKFIPKTHSINLIDVLKTKADLILGQKIRFRHTDFKKEGLLLFKTEILNNLGEIIGEHTSKSKVYAKKKAIKIATKFILEKEAELPEFQSFIAKKKIAEEEKQNRLKAEKQKKHFVFLEEKRVKREVEKERKRKEAKERDIQRVLNKKNRKKNPRTETDKEKILKALADPDLSSSKKQFLEDKLK